MPDLHLRSTGWPCQIVGLGNRETGLCRVHLVGGPDDGREYDGVHYSDLGGHGATIEAAFYGRPVPPGKRRAWEKWWEDRGRRMQRERRQQERLDKREARK